MNARTGAMPPYIAELNEQGGLSSTDIANIAAVSKATVSHWKAGTVRPQPNTQLVLSDLRYAVGRPGAYHEPHEIRLWLYAPHPQLDGKRAIDHIDENRSADVLRILDAEVYLYRMAASRRARQQPSRRCRGVAIRSLRSAFLEGRARRPRPDPMLRERWQMGRRHLRHPLHLRHGR